MRVRRLLVALVAFLLLTAQAAAADWLTKGGSPDRRSVNTDPIGLMEMTEAWRAEGIGQSATQPVVIGDTIYHLAGAFLWEMKINPDGTLVEGSQRALPSRGELWPEPVNMPSDKVRLVSQSSPTYSPQSRMLYFGTAFGRLWAYHTVEQWFRSVDLDWGCPIVGSPLVIHEDGRDWVVIANRPLYPDEEQDPDRPGCSRSDGQVWRIGGLDQLSGTVDSLPYEAETKKTVDGGFGGFITPSPIPGGHDPDGPTFVVGADGFEGGRMIQLGLVRANNYQFKKIWTVDGPSGFAGTIASDGSTGYWLDTAGILWGADLRLGKHPATWPTQSIDIPAAIGAGQVFTNTEPAVETRADGTHLYLTLRNWVPPGATEGQLRAGPTGSDGAVAAIGPGGQVKWYRRFPQTSGGERLSINTAPLAVISQETLLFGDVQGNFYAQALDSSRSDGGHPQPFLITEDEATPRSSQSLLSDGESPAHGPFNFSQVSGVGVDPAMANGLILVGVNYTTPAGPGGRLVAYHVGPGYDLRWLDPPQPLQLTPGQPAAVANAVELRLTQQMLGELCGARIPIDWYLTDDAGAVIRQIGSSTWLPEDLAPGAAWPIHINVSLMPTDPQTGQLVGIIDHPGVVAATMADTPSPAVLLARRIAAAQAMATPKSCQGAAAEVKRLPDSPQPEAGLANNLLIIPWERRAIMDDPAVVGLDVPEHLSSGTAEVRVELMYWNDIDKPDAPVAVRVWARTSADTPAPEGAWEPVTVTAGQRLSLHRTFTGLDAGTWEIIAEVRYTPDTNLSNNRMAALLQVGTVEKSEGGTGSVLTGGE